MKNNTTHLTEHNMTKQENKEGKKATQRKEHSPLKQVTVIQTSGFESLFYKKNRYINPSETIQCQKNEENTTIINRGFDEIGKLVSYILHINHNTRVFKSFGLRSWVGEIGSRIDLISQRRVLRLVGSSFLFHQEKIIPHPAHQPLVSTIIKNEAKNEA